MENDRITDSCVVVSPFVWGPIFYLLVVLTILNSLCSCVHLFGIIYEEEKRNAEERTRREMCEEERGHITIVR